LKLEPPTCHDVIMSSIHSAYDTTSPDGCMHGCMGCMDRWMHAWMDRWMDGHTSLVYKVTQSATWYKRHPAGHMQHGQPEMTWDAREHSRQLGSVEGNTRQKWSAASRLYFFCFECLGLSAVRRQLSPQRRLWVQLPSCTYIFSPARRPGGWAGHGRCFCLGSGPPPPTSPRCRGVWRCR